MNVMNCNRKIANFWYEFSKRRAEEGNIKSLRLKGRERVPANCASITRFIIHMWPFIAYGIDIDGACVAPGQTRATQIEFRFNIS